jgi:exosortase D (VPLPA-CTERM-specific)
MKKVTSASPLVLAIPVLVLLAVIGLVYWETIMGLFRQWIHNEDYSHGLLVAPIAIYLLWERRKKLGETAFSSDWRGLLLLAAALMVRVVGELGAELFTVRFSMLLCLIGGIWLIYGGRLLRVAWFPLAFLFLMLPLPGFIYRNITFSLQLWSTTLSVKILQLMGIITYQEGNIIDIGWTQFQVIEACNGLRYILPLLTLSILLAAFGNRPLWKRIVLTLFAIPVAIAANVVRIVGTGVLASVWGINIAEGFFHSFSGFFVFFFGLAILLLFMRLLMGSWYSSPKEKVETAAEERATERTVSTLAVGIALFVILMSPVAANALGTTEAVKLRQPLTEFPKQFEDWEGRAGTMDEDMWKRVGGQSYTIINYQAQGKPPLNFYTAYYEYQRKGGDFIHSPKLCLPGAGWIIDTSRVRTLARGGAGQGTKALQFNDLVMSKSGRYQLVYYWFQGRDRNFTSEYAAKFYMVWDGIFRRRTDGALVRLVMPLPSENAAPQARDVMDRFAVFASNTLDQFLP